MSNELFFVKDDTWRKRGGFCLNNISNVRETRESKEAGGKYG